MKNELLLSSCVRKNLQRIRKVLRLKQADIADALGLQRTAYTKKETGVVPITLDDLDKMLTKLDHIVLEDLFLGYDTVTVHRSVSGLTNEATLRFPFLEQVILAANLTAKSDDTADLDFLRSCLSYASKKIDGQKTRST